MTLEPSPLAHTASPSHRLFSTSESTSLLSTISYPSARTPAPSLDASLVSDPIPHPSSFTDQQAYRLHLQFRNTLRHLGTINADLRWGIRLLQFLPGSPGSPGHYRMDPSAIYFPTLRQGLDHVQAHERTSQWNFSTVWAGNIPVVQRMDQGVRISASVMVCVCHMSAVSHMII